MLIISRELQNARRRGDGFYGVPSGCVSDQYLLFNVGEFFNMNLKKGNFFKIILIFANIENIN